MRVEKIYVAHDKPFYIPGDIIWTKIWMIDGITHKLLESDELVYVDWVDPSGNVVLSDIVKLENGRGDFSIETERVALTGKYTLRVYSYYQLGLSKAYFFQKSIKLINGQESIATDVPYIGGSYNVQVFPEGGYLIHGLTSQVAFEVRDSSGIAKAIYVKVVDDRDQVIMSTKTNRSGIGLFSLTPTIGRKYYLLLDGHQKIEIPKCLVAGAVMSFGALDPNSIELGIDFSESIKNQVFKIIGHVRGREVLNLDVKTSGIFNYKIDRSQLPSGVIHFTLFDAYDRPISERLVFNDNPLEKVDVDIQLSKEYYEKGKMVNGGLSVTMNDQVVSSSLIMSVYNANLLDLELNDLDMRSYLLLQSDMVQPIHNLASYFDKDNKDYLVNMDLLMMTQYWRRFNWLTMDAMVEHMAESTIEESYTIIGKVVNRYTKNPVKANVILTALDENGGFVNTSHATGDDGLFMFRGLDLRDTTDMFIQAGTYRKPSKREKKKDNVVIRGSKEVLVDWIRYEKNPINVDMTYPSSFGPLPIIEDNTQIQGIPIQAKTYISSYNLEGEEWNIDLDVVTISANRNKAQQRDQFIRNKYDAYGLKFVSKSQRFEVPTWYLEDSYHLDIFSVIERIVPILKIRTIEGQRTVAAGIEPVFFVNGRRMERTLVGQIDPESIQYVDLIGASHPNDLSALAWYGEDLVCNIILNTDNIFEQKVAGNKSITFPGYHDARTFYRRTNVSDEDAANDLDYSTSLLWNPDVEIKDKGYPFSFRAADLPGRHCIYIQGLTNEGIPFVSKKYFMVE